MVVGGMVLVSGSGWCGTQMVVVGDMKGVSKEFKWCGGVSGSGYKAKDSL